METTTCPQCKTTFEVEIETCNNCYFPFNGTEKEKAVFIAQQIRKKSKVKDVKSGIKTAQIILAVKAIFELFALFVYLTQGLSDMFAIAIQVFYILVFGISAFTIKKYPMPSILVPFIFLILSYAILIAVIPALFMQGVLWKILYLLGLAYALNAVIQSNKLSKESNYLAENNPRNESTKKADENLLDDNI